MPIQAQIRPSSMSATGLSDASVITSEGAGIKPGMSLIRASIPKTQEPLIGSELLAIQIPGVDQRSASGVDDGLAWPGGVLLRRQSGCSWDAVLLTEPRLIEVLSAEAGMTHSG